MRQAIYLKSALVALLSTHLSASAYSLIQNKDTQRIQQKLLAYASLTYCMARITRAYGSKNQLLKSTIYETSQLFPAISEATPVISQEMIINSSKKWCPVVYGIYRKVPYRASNQIQPQFPAQLLGKNLYIIPANNGCEILPHHLNALSVSKRLSLRADNCEISITTH